MKKLAILMALLGILAACFPVAQDGTQDPPSVELSSGTGPIEQQPVVVEPVAEALPVEPGVEEPEATPSQTPVAIQQDEPSLVSNAQPQSESNEDVGDPSSNPVVPTGPDVFPPGTNPLTGLPAADPALLTLPPALVSVANFPASARPQAGLSFAPLVFELYIGEGMTRFLALFYGGYPTLDPQMSGDASVTTDNQPEIGPVRSGRLPYQAIRKLYSGFLVMASASSRVKEATTEFTNIYGSDTDDINSALIDVTRLRSIAEANQNALAGNLTGNAFDPLPPAGGQKADSLWVFYNFYNQVRWRYAPASGKYLRFQDRADGSGEFYPADDRLTGEQLDSDNVILMFVAHEVLNSDRSLIDFDLLYTRGKAFLFRDGQLYPILWNTLGGEYEKSTGLLRPIRFTGQDGNPIPLKPGNTWVEILDVSADFREVETGSWKARFYSP